MDKLVVRGTEINVQWDLKRDDFLSLTDIAKIKDSDNPRYIIQNWLRNRNTIEFLGVWETLYNPNFNRVEFDAFRSQAGLNSFVMTPQKWVDATNAIGIVSKAGRYWRESGQYRFRYVSRCAEGAGLNLLASQFERARVLPRCFSAPQAYSPMQQ